MAGASSTIDRGALELVTAPATEPVTRDEAKLHAKIEVTADDTYIDALIVAARELVERLTRRALITQTWKLTLDTWPGASRNDWWDGVREGALSMLDEGAEVEIRKGGFIAVTKVETIAEDATATEWSTTYYYSVARNGFGRLVKKSSATWPPIVAGTTRQAGGIVITFTAGYGATAASVPMALRQAIKNLIAYWYENRTPLNEMGSQAAPMHVASILQQYTVGR